MAYSISIPDYHNGKSLDIGVGFAMSESFIDYVLISVTLYRDPSLMASSVPSMTVTAVPSIEASNAPSATASLQPSLKSDNVTKSEFLIKTVYEAYSSMSEWCVTSNC